MIIREAENLYWKGCHDDVVSIYYWTYYIHSKLCNKKLEKIFDCATYFKLQNVYVFSILTFLRKLAV